MITSMTEYNNMISAIQQAELYALDLPIPANEYKYKIDLNSRIVESPEFLGVTGDHSSEIIWFECDRYFDQYDLLNTVCLIQYMNADSQRYFYQAFPRVDQNDTSKIYIPWSISRNVTQFNGVIQYSFRFFTMDNSNNYAFVLNTLPAKSKVHTTLHISEGEFDPENNYKVDQETISKWLQKMSTYFNGAVINWISAKDFIEQKTGGENNV